MKITTDREGLAEIGEFIVCDDKLFRVYGYAARDNNDYYACMPVGECGCAFINVACVDTVFAMKRTLRG